MPGPHDRIVAPGLRDNDWAHAPYDDMRFAARAWARATREPNAPVLPDTEHAGPASDAGAPDPAVR